MNLITKWESPNKNIGRSGWKPDIIVCHISEGYFESGCEWLCNPSTPASTHFFIARDGRVAQLVSIQDTAWGNGTYIEKGKDRSNENSRLQAVQTRKASANAFTISIEHEGFYSQTRGALTQEQEDAAVELIRYIIDQVKSIYGIDIPIDRQHIVGHSDIAPKWKPNCPGPNYPFDRIIQRLKTPVPPVTPAPAPPVSLPKAAAPPPITVSQPLQAQALSKFEELRQRSRQAAVPVPTSLAAPPVGPLEKYGISIPAGITVQYFDGLIANAAKEGILDKRVNNGVNEPFKALDVLASAGVSASPDYWFDRMGADSRLADVIIAIANKCRAPLEKIIMAEASDDDTDGQLLVGNVIMNRVKSSEFPTSIYDVIFQQGQFEPVHSGAYDRAAPNASVKKAVDMLLYGCDNSQGALYFRTINGATPDCWHERTLVKLFDHGPHRFYK